MSTPDDLAFTELLTHLGGAWTPAGPNRATCIEDGLELTVGMVVGADGSGSVRMGVRPLVGWGWYVVPALLPLGLVQGGAEVFPAFITGFIAVIATRLCVPRYVLRARADARRARLGRQVNDAMAALGASERQ